MSLPDPSLLERVARSLSLAADDAPSGVTASILAQAATSFGARPFLDEATSPTGFDPAAAALFEAVVEAAFLVASSDGFFDEDERAAFEAVVANACGDAVKPSQIATLLADLRSMIDEDGIEKRAAMVARTVVRRDHQLDVLRIAALMAHVSGGVSDPERRILDSLARDFGLETEAVDAALAQAASALQS